MQKINLLHVKLTVSSVLRTNEPMKCPVYCTDKQDYCYIPSFDTKGNWISTTVGPHAYGLGAMRMCNVAASRVSESHHDMQSKFFNRQVPS